MYVLRVTYKQMSGWITDQLVVLKYKWPRAVVSFVCVFSLLLYMDVFIAA